MSRRPRPSAFLGALAAAVVASAPTGLAAQEQPEAARRITVSWTQAPIAEVLRAFAVYSGRSIVAGAGVDGIFVTADIKDQPWDVALRAILGSRGLMGVEDEYGIIRVVAYGDLASSEAVEPVLTRSYRIAYSQAAELQAAIQPLLTDRGSVSAVPSQNTLVVTDIARVQRAVARLLGR